MPIQVIVEATDIGRQRSNPTAIELASSLTFAHRLINKALVERMRAERMDMYGFDEHGESNLNSEPSLVNLHIAEVHNGSVILNGIIEAANNPFVQGVAGGILANIITPGITAIARRTRRTLTRPGRASAGRTLTVTIISERVVLRAHCEYREYNRTHIVIDEYDR